jgi:hypothetical protein
MAEAPVALKRRFSALSSMRRPQKNRQKCLPFGGGGQKIGANEPDGSPILRHSRSAKKNNCPSVSECFEARFLYVQRGGSGSHVAVGRDATPQEIT